MIALRDLGDGVRQIEFCRPERRNALGVAAYAALADALLEIGADETARVVLISGHGASFCAGNDRAEFATEWPQPPQGPVVRFLEALHGLDLPVIAAVQGAAIGIGATLLLHCDLVVATPDAFLQYPFVDLGISPEGASSLLLPRRIGQMLAMDLFLTGRRVPAAEALGLGLVSRLSATEALLDEARVLAHAIAGKPAAAVRATKRLVRDQTLRPLFEREIATINSLLVRR